MKQSSKDSDGTLIIIHHQDAKGTEKSFQSDNMKHCVLILYSLGQTILQLSLGKKSQSFPYSEYQPLTGPEPVFLVLNANELKSESSLWPLGEQT